MREIVLISPIRLPLINCPWRIDLILPDKNKSINASFREQATEENSEKKGCSLGLSLSLSRILPIVVENRLTSERKNDFVRLGLLTI